jgi:hypothetical protein
VPGNEGFFSPSEKAVKPSLFLCPHQVMGWRTRSTSRKPSLTSEISSSSPAWNWLRILDAPFCQWSNILVWVTRKCTAFLERCPSYPELTLGIGVRLPILCDNAGIPWLHGLSIAGWLRGLEKVDNRGKAQDQPNEKTDGHHSTCEAFRGLSHRGSPFQPDGSGSSSREK